MNGSRHRTRYEALEDKPMKWTGILSTLIFLALNAQATTLFETDFRDGWDENQWVVVGQPTIEATDDDTAPEFGPQILSIDNDASIMGIYLKEFEFTDGIVEVLWKDAEVAQNADRDVDGPLFARANIEESADNAMWVGYIMELDADSGFHVNVGDGAQAPVLDAMPELKSSGTWNWIEWRLDGPLLQLKTWDARDDKPEAWMLEAEDTTYPSGQVGIEVWSGLAHIAFFRISDLEGPSTVEPRGRLASLWSVLKHSE